MAFTSILGSGICEVLDRDSYRAARALTASLVDVSPRMLVLEMDSLLVCVLVAPGKWVMVAKRTRNFLGTMSQSREMHQGSNLCSTYWVSDFGQLTYFPPFRHP